MWADWDQSPATSSAAPPSCSSNDVVFHSGKQFLCSRCMRKACQQPASALCLPVLAHGSHCPGVSFSGAVKPWPASFRYTYYNGVRVLQLRLGPSLPLRQPIHVRPTRGPVLPCNKSLT